MVKVSIIIVNYHVKEELFNLLESIIKTRPKVSYEVIVVDNDEVKTIGKELKARFPKVIYIESVNKGYGYGNNVGAKRARGDYLFFINPDTKLLSNCADILFSYLEKHKDVGIAAPYLFYDRRPYPFQGTRTLTPVRAVFTFSILGRLFPNNPVSRNFWLLDSREKSVKQVEAVPGTAFMIRKDVFRRVGGFDPKFFIYFEENDICKKVVTRGYKIVMLESARVFHILGASAEKSKKDLSKIFVESRFYYLSKHFGISQAMLAELFLRFNKFTFLILAIILLDLALRLTFLSERMTFIGDQAWFYLSARDLLLKGDVPLVGITSSHTWLHQGPIWTYLLALPLWIFNFDPVSGVYLVTALSVFSLVLFHLIGREVSSPLTGVFASLLYAASPYFIIRDRMPYHTSPIPFFFLLLTFSLIKAVKGSPFFLPLCLFSVSVLYGLHLSTVVFIPPLIGVLLYGYITKKAWFKKLLNLKILTLSFVSLVLPMVPILIYDFQNGFPQTIKYAGWFVYKFMQTVGIISGSISEHPYSSVFGLFLNFYTKLIFIANEYIAILIIIPVFYVIYKSFAEVKTKFPTVVISIFTAIAFVSYLLAKTPSEAYLPIIFPGIILLLSLFIFELSVRFSKPVSFLFLAAVVTSNLYVVMSSYLVSDKYGYFDYQNRLRSVKEIQNKSEGNPYNLKILGPGSQFQTTPMTYEYLSWWLFRNPPVKQKQEFTFIINEETMEVNLKRN